MSSEYKVGDRVKVTIEGEVSHAFEDGRIRIPTNADHPVYVLEGDKGVTIERVVETFKAGDRVRSKAGFEYTIGNGGFISHLHNTWWTDNEPFTSDEYKLVYRSPEATP